MIEPLANHQKESVRAQNNSAFGLMFSDSSVQESAELIAASPSSRMTQARIYITPNIQHVSEMRKNRELFSAMREADLLTCDGFPLVSYARLRGCEIPGRVAGREVVEHLMLHTALDNDHILYFLMESTETANAVYKWAKEREIQGKVIVEVAPQHFGENTEASAAFASRVHKSGATILFIGLGAPKSELFVTRFRGQLGGCWALCIGQSVRVVLGLVRQPPRLLVTLRLEWLWRIMLEPRRLFGRYASASVGFIAAIIEDLGAR